MAPRSGRGLQFLYIERCKGSLQLGVMDVLSRMVEHGPYLNLHQRVCSTLRVVQVGEQQALLPRPRRGCRHGEWARLKFT